MDQDIPVMIGVTTITGKAPIVIVGANGSGKTTFGARLAENIGATWLSALRMVHMGDTLEVKSPSVFERSLSDTRTAQLRTTWSPSSDTAAVLSKLYSEHTEDSVRHRAEELAAHGHIQLTPTRWEHFKVLWERHFSLRKLTEPGHRLTAKSLLADGETAYGASRLSDGERSAVYAIAKVLNADAGPIIVDEPEEHLHSELARRLWNDLEREREDCRFVYITHDLGFALSRQEATIVVMQSDGVPRVLPQGDPIPADVVQDVIGAMSFMVSAKRIVFCEGDRSRSIDWRLYSAWFDQNDTAVIPVHSCDQVRQCVAAFNKSNIVAGGGAMGIVDRDFWPDEYLRGSDEVFALDLHEIESLLFLLGVFSALAEHDVVSEIDATHDEFIRRSKSNFSGEQLQKVIMSRAKKRIECMIEHALDSAQPNKDAEASATSLAQAVSDSLSPEKVAAIYECETERANRALCGTDEEFLKLFPGKLMWGEYARALGKSKDKVLDLVCAGLRATDAPGSPLHHLGQQLEAALAPHLPSRHAT